MHIPSYIILNVSAIAYTCLLTVPTLNSGASDAKFIRNTVQHVSSAIHASFICEIPYIDSPHNGLL